MRHPARWLLVIVLALVVIGLMRLRFAVQVLDILPADLPVVQGLRLYQEHFANSRELILTISAPEGDQAEAAAQVIATSLRRQSNLVSRVTWQAPWLEHPEQGAELVAYSWLNQPPSLFQQLAERLKPETALQTLNATREQLAVSLSPQEIARLSYDPFELSQVPGLAGGGAPFGQEQDLFSSADGRFRIIFAQARPELPNYRACLQWLSEVKQAIQAERKAGRFPEVVEVGYTGAPAFVAEISHGMESDLRMSVTSTVIIIVVLFWWTHRRLMPLLWLLALLSFILAGTLAIGGLLFGTLSVISVGFAAILLGLAVDYGLVLYQEALHAPSLGARGISRTLFPSILWSAVTTCAAFLLLTLGGLPGLAQLGALVAIGLGFAAVVMLTLFLPPLMKGLRAVGEPAADASSQAGPALRARQHLGSKFAWAATIALVIAGILIVSRRPPVLDPTANALRPLKSFAYAGMEEIKQRISSIKDPEWLVISAADETEMGRKLDQLEPRLQRAVSGGQVQSFHLPTALIPRPERQATNLAMAKRITGQSASLRELARTNGFTERSLAFTEGIFETWQRASQNPVPFWPSNDVSTWALQKLIVREPQQIYALGLLQLGTNAAQFTATELWAKELQQDQVYLASWSQLGSSLLGVVKKDFWRVALPMGILLPFSLWLAFKRINEVVLSLATLALSSLCLLAWMTLAGWTWNLLNLMAVPLLLGAGVDYSIHMQLGLRRHQGNLPATRRTIGRALFLCAATTVAGFGSNAWSSNGGLVSLGKVCAVGIGLAYLTAVFLLPYWWRTWNGKLTGAEIKEPLAGPSSFYRADLWRLGLWLVRTLPHQLCVSIIRLMMRTYWWLAPERRNVVMRNLLPALNDDPARARQKSKDLFQQFGGKLLDLWRYEAGLPIDHLLGASTGWEHFVEAQAQKRGVLLLTTHLGNWEFGGPWLTSRGFTLQVVTLAEPGKNFTELRQASRARWKIDTLVIGDDPFAFVEILRRLENGATVALLVDRPPAATSVEVELFGRSFPASKAAAELARASGCVLLPVYLPRLESNYGAHILPAIPYDRAALRDQQARQVLTQQIMRAFEPVIRQHLDQWYHFVPVWPK